VSIKDVTGGEEKPFSFLVNPAERQRIPTTLRTILALANSQKTEGHSLSLLEMNIGMLFAAGSGKIKITESLFTLDEIGSVTGFLELNHSEFFSRTA
jgi:hypothetical protein